VQLSYPCGTSKEKAVRKDKAFLLGELLVEKVQLSYPSVTSKEKADSKDKAFLFGRRLREK
jgi:hypothetical protein